MVAIIPGSASDRRAELAHALEAAWLRLIALGRASAPREQQRRAWREAERLESALQAVGGPPSRRRARDELAWSATRQT